MSRIRAQQHANEQKTDDYQLTGRHEIYGLRKLWTTMPYAIGRRGIRHHLYFVTRNFPVNCFFTREDRQLGGIPFCSAGGCWCGCIAVPTRRLCRETVNCWSGAAATNIIYRKADRSNNGPRPDRTILSDSRSSGSSRSAAGIYSVTNYICSMWALFETIVVVACPCSSIPFSSCSFVATFIARNCIIGETDFYFLIGLIFLLFT